MKWKVPKVWDGGQCVIIGGGPSIIKQFGIPEELVKQVYSGRRDISCYAPYLEPIHDQKIIAVNMAYKLGDFTDVLFFGDPNFWRMEQEGILGYYGLKVTCGKSLDKIPQVKYLEKDRSRAYGISTDPEKLMFNFNSGSAAINLAVHFGVKRIILLGFDMSLDTRNNQHWHKRYSTEKEFVFATFRTQCYGFPTMVHELTELGVEVINCSPDSAIEGFPKCNFKDIKL